METNIQLPRLNTNVLIGAERKFSMVPLQRNTRTAARITANPTCTKASEKMMA